MLDEKLNRLIFIIEPREASIQYQVTTAMDYGQ